MTEILDFLRLLYARIGKTISPITGLEVKKDSVSDVMKFLSDQPEGVVFPSSAPSTLKQQRIPFMPLWNALLRKDLTAYTSMA
jgi:excinuclease ABC subunit A